MEIKGRKAVNEKLKVFDYLAGDSDFIEVTEWSNGEGWDIDLSENKHISLTIGELDAINYLTKYLDYYSKDKS